MSYISKAGILTITPSCYIVIFSLWRCIYIIIKSPHNIFKDWLNRLNSLRAYRYRRAHTFSWHNYTSKIKCQAPTELPTRALLFWDRSRFSFPFLLNSFQRDLGRFPGALSAPGEDLEVGEEHLRLGSSFIPVAMCKSGDALGPWPSWLWDMSFPRANKSSGPCPALLTLLGKPSTPRPAETTLGPHIPQDSWAERI